MGSSEEDTETISEEGSDVYEETDFKEVIEKADELQEDYHQRRANLDRSDSMPDLELGTWLTGISNGEIIDIKIDSEMGDLLLTVRSEDTKVRKVRVRDKQSTYIDKNEIVRLLEYKDIDEGRIEKLLGKEIPIYVDRYALPSNEWSEMKWKAYIPKKTNTISKFKHKADLFFRYLGYEGEFQGKMMAIGFLGVSLFWWSLLFGVISTGFVALNSFSAPYGLILTLVTILSFIMTVYTPLMMRFLRIVREKYAENRKEDTTIY